MMQEAIVSVIVAYAAWVVAKRYAPKSVRIALNIFVVRVAKRFGWNKIVEKFGPKALVSTGRADGCGTCGGCGTAGTTPTEKQFTITPQALKQTIIK